MISLKSPTDYPDILDTPHTIRFAASASPGYEIQFTDDGALFIFYGMDVLCVLHSLSFEFESEFFLEIIGDQVEGKELLWNLTQIKSIYFEGVSSLKPFVPLLGVTIFDFYTCTIDVTLPKGSIVRIGEGCNVNPDLLHRCYIVTCTGDRFDERYPSATVLEVLCLKIDFSIFNKIKETVEPRTSVSLFYPDPKSEEESDTLCELRCRSKVERVSFKRRKQIRPSISVYPIDDEADYRYQIQKAIPLKKDLSRMVVHFLYGPLS